MIKCLQLLQYKIINNIFCVVVQLLLNNRKSSEEVLLWMDDCWAKSILLCFVSCLLYE